MYLLFNLAHRLEKLQSFNMFEIKADFKLWHHFKLE